MSKVMIDMEMPKSCVECRFCIYVNSGISLHCKVKQKEIPLRRNARSTECPLQEVREKMAKLKPCPFCGGIATLYTEEIPNGYSGDINYIIECTNCEATVHGYDTEQQAIDAWNRRSQYDDDDQYDDEMEE